MIKKRPEGAVLEHFLREWNSSDVDGKRAMQAIYGATYGTMANWASQANKPTPMIEAPKYGTLEEHFKAFIEIDRLNDYHQRTPSELVLSIATDKPIAVCDSADWHIGMSGTDYTRLYSDIQTIAGYEDRLRLLLGGDNLHNIIQQSKMGSSHNQMPISLQKATYFMILDQLAAQVLAMGTGNHDYWSALQDGEDWNREVASRLKLVYMKHRAVIHLTVGSMRYDILWMHKGRFNSADNITNSAKQYQRKFYPDARIVITEHTHRASCENYEYNLKHCVAMIPGSYAVRDDRAESEGYAPVEPHSPAVVLFPNEDKIIGFLDFTDALDYIKPYYKKG